MKLEGRMAAVKRLFGSLICMIVMASVWIQVANPSLALAGVVVPLQSDWEAVERQALALARYGATAFVQSGQIVALDDVPEDILPAESLLRQHVGPRFLGAQWH